MALLVPFSAVAACFMGRPFCKNSFKLIPVIIRHKHFIVGCWAPLRWTIQSVTGREIWTTRSLVPSHVKPPVMQSLPSEKPEQASATARLYTQFSCQNLFFLVHKRHYSPFLHLFPAFLSLFIAFFSIFCLSLPPLFCTLLYQTTTYLYNGWSPSPHILFAHSLFS